MMTQRPDPDRLLASLKAQEESCARGKLKIFFGACAGVGKTYAMLQAAAQQQQEGLNVLIGTVETHGRRETAQLLDGLTLLPSRRIEYRGRVLAEFDIEAALAYRPALIIVDELAHSNVEGSRHAKRWQDVEELLAAGIDVYTALNVQHLESLNDIVAGITGVKVRETVPDVIFDRADEVSLVDLPPDELLRRLAEGKVYLPEAAERAAKNFFRKGNLIALRELALRRTADRVDAQMQAYRADRATQTIRETRDRFIVCIGNGPDNDKLVRKTARLVSRLQADWIAVHVDESRSGHTAKKARQGALDALKLAEQLGAETTTLSGNDVAGVLVDYALSRNAGKLVIGARPASFWRKIKPGLAQRLQRLRPDLDILLVGLAPQSKPQRRITKPGSFRLIDYAWASLACALTTLLSSALLRVFDPANIIMLFLLTVVLVSIRLGQGPGAWAAMLAVGCFDFFFIEPYWSFDVGDAQYLFTFALMLGVALLIGQMAAKLHREARIAGLRERRAIALSSLARDLSGALVIEQIVDIVDRHLPPLFGNDIALLLPDSNELVKSVGAHRADESVAQWVYGNQTEAGAGTQTLAAAAARYLPLKAPMRTRGVLALTPGQTGVMDEPELKRLLDACAAQIALALERVHYVEVAQDALVKMEGERLRNTLLSAVSHDLKTPLTAIVGLAGALACDPAKDTRQELTNAIRSEADSMTRLVTNLLDMARLQSEGVRLRRDWQSLEEVVGSALHQLSYRMTDHPVAVSIPSDFPLLEFDALLLERVLVNLLDNAAKYTPAQTHIAISADYEGGMLTLRLEDNGPGLPDTTGRLLEPFTRGEIESSISGVGLGLALSRMIVEAHGGKLGAGNRAQGGARFIITLPTRTAPPPEEE